MNNSSTIPTISRDKLGRYYFCIPETLSKKPDIQGPKETEENCIASIDPGVRTFATMYDPSGLVAE
ncbi:MAG TPA: hypothetical protein VM260_14730 [Pirellula sp.]|nr:hypothetical protein [Pirellula sp.]